MRNQIEIEKEELEKYFAMHKTYKEIAEKYGCSPQTVMKKALSFGMRSDARKYQMMEDNPARRAEVQQKIRETITQMWKDGVYEDRKNGMAGVEGKEHPNYKIEGGKTAYREKARYYHPEAVCCCCGKQLSWDDDSIEVHHVDNDHENYCLTNLQPLCHSCHRKYHRPNQPFCEITKKFVFDACHYLPYHDAKCKYLHGHTYHLEVSVKNRILQETGMVMDFGEIKRIVTEKVLDVFDHSFFNDVIPYPTCEYMIHWIWKQLSTDIKGLSRIVLYETDGSYAMISSGDVKKYLQEQESDWRTTNEI